MKTFSYTTNSTEETISLGKKIGAKLQKGDVIAMQGTLGAGKTTITKGIAQALGITETITSPTFCLISEYEGSMPLYHFDVYRIDGGDDFDDLGADDMIYGDGVSIIEWSEKIMEKLPKNTIILRIEKTDSASGSTLANEKLTSTNTNVSPSSKTCADSRIITLENWNYGEVEK